MRRHILFASLFITLSACSRLDSIPYQPPQTPASWLTIQPYVTVPLGASRVILVQPSTTFFVYLLGLVAIGAGLYFLWIRGHHRSRFWWGVALGLWGLGALFAGTSYEAFSYQIKCAGRTLCGWTSPWEIIYLILSAASVDAMLLAEAYACAAGRWRKILAGYALLNALGYTGIVLWGSWVPIQFLISFELLLVVAAPSVVLFIFLNAWRFIRYRLEMDRVLLGTWIGLAVTLGAYFLYLVLGWTPRLWAQGFWFSENDVLHLGLIAWMLYIARVTAPHIVDWRPEQTCPSGSPLLPK